MIRYRRMEITCYILYVKGKAKKQKAKANFLLIVSLVKKIANTACDK